MKAEDNPFPYVTLVEGTTPAAPAAGRQREFIDSADHKLKRVNSAGTVTTVEGGSGGGGGTPETYDAAVAAALTGVVHRWKFDDASGASVADSVGSLTLTMSGTYTRHVASLTGFGTTFGASAKATSSGLGSVPVGNSDRCAIALFRSTASAAQTLFSYGAQSTRQWFTGGYTPSSLSVSLTAWGDDLSLAAPSSRAELLDPTSGADWHLCAWGYKGSAQTTYAYCDGTLVSRLLGGVLNTATSGNVQVGQDTVTFGNNLAGDVDDVLVMNNWPGKAKLDRLLCAAAGIVYTP